MDNPNAFPTNDITPCHPGMTLRDWFAGQALSVMAGMQIGHGLTREEIARVVSEAAFVLADAMLAERNPTNG
jgi:hypothetical protein